MIGFLRGQVLERRGNALLIDVGGVGYQVVVTMHHSARTGEPVELFVHTAVREDAIQLYGFGDRLEKDLFDLLIDVQGIGPVKAMQILQTPAEELVLVLQARDAARISRVPGIGRKTAERILIDVSDKLDALAVHQQPKLQPEVAEAGPKEDLVSALVNLGFRGPLAEETAEATLKVHGDTLPIQDLVRLALAALRSSRPKET
ncbi:MAG: Holliday junction branch migration protein RuvA [Myxococcales bacterium]|nr:Holliday junction branch migration protein RuvA [Myxococcales bacterium]